MNEVKILNLSYGNFVLLEDYEKLQQQLKQRDEVIDEAIKYIEDKNRIDNYLDGVPCSELLEILKKYKGDNNEGISSL